MRAPDRRAALERFLVLDPGDSFTRYALALEDFSDGAVDAGIARLRDVLDRDAAYVPAWHRLGQALCGLGRLEEAREAYRKGIAAARAAGDAHAASEMTTELEDMEELA